ncbi:MAG: MerR family transcriptional regulator [Candidatus Sulfotelmatobacter sp.]
MMYFPAEHLLDKLQISAMQLEDFEKKGIVHGVSKAGRVFYSSRDMYRLRGILKFMSGGLSVDEAKWHVDYPTQEVASSEGRG